jgi:intracellular septation protein
MCYTYSIINKIANIMKLLFDFFPILIFFAGYKLFDIYIATLLAMLASFALVVFYRLKHQRYEKMQVISLILIAILGGSTLFFHNPWFIKWKPTGIYWLSALVFLGSAFIAKKPLIQTMMEQNICLPTKIWYRLNTAWVIFFLLMGLVNLYVAYNYTTDFWVNFKLLGGVGFTLLFVCIQAFFLSKHMDATKIGNQ